MPIIRKGTIQDILHITRIYENILEQEEQGTVTTGWVRGIYPTKQTALDALKAEELFVMLQEKTVVAAARINQVQMPAYKYTWFERNKSYERNTLWVSHSAQKTSAEE